MDAAKEENARECRERDAKRKERIENLRYLKVLGKPVVCLEPVWMFQCSVYNQHGVWMLYISRVHTQVGRLAQSEQNGMGPKHDKRWQNMTSLSRHEHYKNKNTLVSDGDLISWFREEIAMLARE